LDTTIKVAVMGCEVNGPGESKDADIGIAGGNGRAIIFRKGVKTKVVAEADMLTALMSEIKAVMAEQEAEGTKAVAN
jgi:(E)-4-hydroxy-3-methylbut-2-enyl-diphosphate synthase